MIRCSACGSAIADGYEVDWAGRFYHKDCDLNMDLTPDETRLIEERRTVEAVTSRPVESTEMLKDTKWTLRALVKFGGALDPKDQTWIELLVIIDKYWP